MVVYNVLIINNSPFCSVTFCNMYTLCRYLLLAFYKSLFELWAVSAYAFGWPQVRISVSQNLTAKLSDEENFTLPFIYRVQPDRYSTAYRPFFLYSLFRAGGNLSNNNGF